MQAQKIYKIGGCRLFWRSAEKGLMRSGIPSPGKELRIDGGGLGQRETQHAEATVAE